MLAMGVIVVVDIGSWLVNNLSKDTIDKLCTTSIVRRNLLTRKNYSPYCGKDRCEQGWPRTTFNGNQFQCKCGWVSNIEESFMEVYKKEIVNS